MRKGIRGRDSSLRPVAAGCADHAKAPAAIAIRAEGHDERAGNQWGTAHPIEGLRGARRRREREGARGRGSGVYGLEEGATLLVCGPGGCLTRRNSGFLFFTRLGIVDVYGLLRAGVHVKLKNVRPGIMADHIQVVFPPNNQSAIDLSNQHSFAFHVGPREKIPERIYDTTAPTADNGVGILPKNGTIIRRKIAASIELIARKYEATSLDGDVAH